MPAPPTPAARAFEALRPARAWLAQHDARTLDAQVTLAEIPAPTGGEAARGRHVGEAFQRLGMPATIDAVGNVLARRDGTSGEPAVVVCAHLDTVFEQATVHVTRREHGIITGPGIGDNARGLAGMLAIAEAMQATAVRTRRPILFSATTGEEGAGDLRGARHLFATAASDAWAAIALDGAGDERVVTHALGIRRFRVHFAGPGGHSWASYGVANALHAAAALAAELAAWRLPSTPRSALTVSRMAGGTAINAIPDAAWLEVDVRSISSRELDRLERDLRVAARRAADGENARRRPATPEVTADVAVIGDRPGGGAVSAPFIADAAFDATRLIGRLPEAAVASTDANIPLSLGVPAVALGAGGRGGDTHTPHEWFENRDGALGLARVMTLLVTLAGLA